jgi:hypothetical protein
VTHYGVEPGDIETAIAAFRQVLADMTPTSPRTPSAPLAGAAT